jgi:Mrp family chromosome partitioning ATPase/capsular polysaccharide biosynthesis protein
MAVASALAYSFLRPRVYRSSTTVVFDVPTNAVQPTAQTLAELVDTYGVANAIIKRLGLGMMPKSLVSNMTVITKPDTAAVTVLYDDTDQARGIRIVRTFDDVFVPLAQKLLEDETQLSLDAGSLPKGGFFTARVADHRFVGKVEPKPVRNVAVAAVLGLLLGVVAGMVREQFDDTVRGVEGAEEAFGQPATVSLPSGVLGHRPFAGPTRRGLDPVMAELAIQRLVADILWTPESRDTRTLLVTSGRPEEGKTTVTANLAVELASAGYRVIVVEADLRRPMLHHYLELDASAGQIGLDAVIRGTATLTSTMVEVPVWQRNAQERTAEGRQSGPRTGEGSGRLRAIVAGPGHQWPSEVEVKRVQEILSTLRNWADYVIFDAPPILVVPDAYPLVSAVDAVVAVVRSDRSTRKSTASMSRLIGRLGAQRVTLVVTEVEGAQESGYYAYATPRPS